MNQILRKRSDVIQVGTIPLLAVLLVASLTAGPFPQTALAQKQEQDLSMRFLSDNYYSEITAGESRVLLLELENTGTKAIHDIELSVILPEGWTFDLEPDRIASLNPADFRVVKVTITTAPRSAKERYEIILRADSIAVHRAISAWMMVVPPAGRWLWVGGILTALVVAGFVVIFMRFGRD